MEISEDKKKILAEIEAGTAVIIEGVAGTGKTIMGVLCGQKLLNFMLPWQRVLYLTFSKLAKRQISECIQKMTSFDILSTGSANRMDVLNYHSFWWQLINKQSGFLGISQKPLLCTSAETQKLARELLGQAPPDIVPNSFLRMNGNINLNKEHLILKALSGSAAVYAQWGSENFGREAEGFVGEYDFLQWAKEQIFSRNREGLFSHAETVCWAHSLLTNHQNEMALLRGKYPVVIIDEFQDMDLAQWNVIQLFAPKTLIVMADPAQTIHMWRGADPNRIQQFETFCQSIPWYAMLGTRTLQTCHRAPRPMSDHSNITWIELKVGADSANLHKMNLATRYAKGACKDYAKKSVKNGKNVGILCLTNEIADDITSFLRERQTFKNGGYISEIPCMRLGAENSPFESARSLVLQLHNDACRNSTGELHGFLANSVFQTYLPCRVKNCSANSRDKVLKKRWSRADKISGLLCEEFGVGLRKLAGFMVEQAKLLNCYCDFGIIGCLKHVGSAISRLGTKGWKELPLDERRRKIDSAVLQYENANASSRLTVPISVMTIHQSKSREFSVVILPWFTNIPWSPKDSVWDTSRTEHENLFHTACTRSKDEAFVIFPKGQAATWPAQ